MIDISDGLGSDILHLCHQGGVGVRLFLENLPVAPGVRSIAERLKREAGKLVLFGGEDYELCFTVPGRNVAALTQRIHRKTGTDVSVVGEIVADRRVREVVDRHGIRMPLTAEGWDHFRTGSTIGK